MRVMRPSSSLLVPFKVNIMITCLVVLGVARGRNRPVERTTSRFDLVCFIPFVLERDARSDHLTSVLTNHGSKFSQMSTRHSKNLTVKSTIVKARKAPTLDLL